MCAKGGSSAPRHHPKSVQRSSHREPGPSTEVANLTCAHRHQTFARMLRPRRARVAAIAGAAVAVIVALVLIFGRSGGGKPRVMVLGFDGMDPQTVDLLMS